MFSFAIGLLVFGIQLIAYGVVSNWLAKRRIYRQRLASLRSTEYAPQRQPVRFINRPGEN